MASGQQVDKIFRCGHVDQQTGRGGGGDVMGTWWGCGSRPHAIKPVAAPAGGTRRAQQAGNS